MCLCKCKEEKGDKLQISGSFLSSELREQSIITLFVFFKQREKYNVSKQVRNKKGKHGKSYTSAYKQKPRPPKTQTVRYPQLKKAERWTEWKE